MQPLTVGILRHDSSAEAKASRSPISQAGVATLTPFSCSSLKRFPTSSPCAFVRDRRIRFLALRLTIHRAMLRPSPPSPPAMTYEEFSSNSVAGSLLGTICFNRFCQLAPPKRDLFSTSDVTYIDDIIIPKCDHRLPCAVTTLKKSKCRLKLRCIVHPERSWSREFSLSNEVHRFL